MGIFIIEELNIDKLITRIEILESENTGIMVGGISNYIKENRIYAHYDRSVNDSRPITVFFATIRSCAKESKSFI